ncbi:hypothetical protein Y032_0040g338 [Ancylostoma ceylanicum]|uniref:TIL domain-containing protein n=1 Tax=Ancylostoma ceylanicum TaxID=53326 RepID=A0A016UIL5_9BILA|nr:hypothetical protein Y032_0040g338 [Ancylostoma ceylanicum]
MLGILSSINQAQSSALLYEMKAVDCRRWNARTAHKRPTGDDVIIGFTEEHDRRDEVQKRIGTTTKERRVVDLVMFFYLFATLIWVNYATSTREPTSAEKNSACANVSCAECKNFSDDCICVMVKPQWCIDGDPCEDMFPRCIPRNQSCFPSFCSSGKCEFHDVTCVMAPCWPIKQCDPVLCPPNEEWKDCAAFCEPSCTSPAPLCPDICKPGRCQCKEGFFRRAYSCVPSSGCKGIPLQGPGG